MQIHTIRLQHPDVHHDAINFLGYCCTVLLVMRVQVTIQHS